MTNLIFAITLSLITNWTGLKVGTNELGYVMTNHTANIVYHGATNSFVLLSEPSDLAVWRTNITQWVTNMFYFTNWWRGTNYLEITNLWVTNDLIQTPNLKVKDLPITGW
jgi:hypothetical protein